MTYTRERRHSYNIRAISRRINKKKRSNSTTIKSSMCNGRKGGSVVVLSPIGDESIALGGVLVTLFIFEFNIVVGCFGVNFCLFIFFNGQNDKIRI